jgi:hypothetical protein
MRKEDFYVGCEFYTATGKWRCTDVGTRVIVAIKLDKEDDSWYAGPPYAVAEDVFDEYDFEGCDRVDRFKEFREQEVMLRKEDPLDVAFLQATEETN